MKGVVEKDAEVWTNSEKAGETGKDLDKERQGEDWRKRRELR